MFITVRFGDDQREVFNPDCLNNLLLEAIKAKCSCDCSDVVDLCSEGASVKLLHQNPEEKGSAFLSDREEFILVKVDKVRRHDNAFDIKYTPLLREKELDGEFIAKLNQQFVNRKESRARRISISKRRITLKQTK